MDLVKALPGGWTSLSVAAFLIAAGAAMAIDPEPLHAVAVQIERDLLGAPLISETADVNEDAPLPLIPPAPKHELPCDTAQWQPFIAEAARRFDVLERWLDAIMRAESAGCLLLDGRPTTSPAGAMGLMQLMPETWQTYRDRLMLGSNPYQPRDNIVAGAAYLRDLYDRFGWPGAAAAYHAGPARYSEYVSTGRSLPSATRDYLARIDRILGVQHRAVHQSDRAPRKSAAADSRTYFPLPPTQSVTSADVAPYIDRPSDPASKETLFVPLRHGTRPPRIQPGASPDVQKK